MNRIASFKNSPVEFAIQTRSTSKNGRTTVTQVRDSLVGATQHLNGSKTTYTYADGHTCGHSDGEFHDCAYVSARNRLISRAEMDANAECRRRANEVPPPNFDRLFFANMDAAWGAR